MQQEIEIEFKHMLTKDQFDAIYNNFPFTKNPIVQTNHYFETNNQDLIQKKCALRIREINGTYTSTFKEPHPDGILETHDSLSTHMFDTWINDQVTHTPNVASRLAAHAVPLQDIHSIGALTTARYTYQTEHLEYVLDRSSYNGIVDYELEIESVTFDQGNEAYQHIVQQFNLQKEQPITKIERFLQTYSPKQ